MALSKSLLLLVVVAAVFAAASAQDNCSGVPNGAKYRYILAYQPKDSSDAGKQALAAAVSKWMKEDCSKAMNVGQGLALPTTPTIFGVVPPSNQELADFASYSDWASMDDFKACINNGLKSGNLVNVRNMAKRAWRSVIDNSNAKGSCAQGPATVRYILAYTLDNTQADTCKRIDTTQAKIAGQSVVVSGGHSCNVVASDPSVLGPGIQNTADYAAYVDFKSMDDVAKYFAPTDNAVKTARTEQRGASRSAVRILINLPQSGKESGNAAAQTQDSSCSGVPQGAKYRYVLAYQAQDSSDAGKKALAAAVSKWMKEDCSKALAVGQGLALPTTPTTFGVLPSSNQELADFAAYSDWASMDDFMACINNGLKSGNLVNVRNMAKRAWRSIIDNSNAKGSCAQGPATVRYILAYTLDNTQADTCKRIDTTQAKIAGQSMVVRSGNSCNAIASDPSVLGPGVQNTADYAAYVDFKSMDDVAKYFVPTDNAVRTARSEQRGASRFAVRILVSLDGKEAGTGRRMKL